MMNSQSHNYAGEAVAPAKQSPIAHEMLRLRESGSELHTLLDKLEERLSQILRPIPPQAVGDEGKALHESPLHGALAGQADVVARAGSRIVSVLDRLTL